MDCNINELKKEKRNLLKELNKYKTLLNNNIGNYTSVCLDFARDEIFYIEVKIIELDEKIKECLESKLNQLLP
jgi:hypothetical protein